MSPLRRHHVLRFGSGLVAALAVAGVAGAVAVGAGSVAAAVSTASVIRFVAGPHAITDSSNRTWLSDGAYARGGSLTTTSRSIVGTTYPGLFPVERFGDFDYAIPVSAGTYKVSLGMAEHYFATSGSRVFGVLANGRTVVPKVDPVAEAGPFTALTVDFTTEVSNAGLILSFADQVNYAAISNVTVTRVDDPPIPSSAAPSSAAPSSAAPSSAAASSAAPVTYITPESFGAVGNGVTDDTAALQAAFDSARNGATVRLQSGRVYAHSDVLHLRNAGMKLIGSGVLLATNESRSSVWIEGDNIDVEDVVFKTAHTTQRWGAWEQMGVRIVGHTGEILRRVSVIGSAAAGIYVGDGAAYFVLDHVTVTNTRADGVHMTDGSHNGVVTDPVVTNSGDDGVAVVSYSQDGAPCHDITVTSPTVLGTTWGRGLSVVGGTNIQETNIDVERTDAAAVYLAAEGSPWFTSAPQNVTVTGGKIVGANSDATVDHGAVLVLSGESNVMPANVTVEGLSITGTRATASRDFGVVTYGKAPTAVLFANLTIVGGPKSAYSGNTAQSSYRTRTIVQNGVRLADQG